MRQLCPATLSGWRREVQQWRVVSFSRSAVCRADSSSVGFITVLLFFSQISTNSISVPRSRSRASRARTDSHTVAVLSLG